MREPPLKLDRYVLDEPIAKGGMATVYFARQTGAAGFSKAVAIKRMRPDLVHEREFVELFLDEARLAARVRHGNVVGVIDVVSAGNELLLVMEYFHGESLGRLLETARTADKQVPPAIAVGIMTDILHGLHAAHEAKGDDGTPLGIVHRDVSPQNVIVGIDGVARVADFGIARAAGQLHATDDGKTRGKAGYSAPEQLRRGEVSRRVDLFAAGALLWEMLVGRRLFEGETQAAVVTAVLTDPITAPGLYAPDVPQEVDDIILKCLDRDPKRRPVSANDLALALERALAPASPATVGAWVRELAHEALEKREAIVRRIEKGDGVPSNPGLLMNSPVIATSGSISIEVPAAIDETASRPLVNATPSDAMPTVGGRTNRFYVAVGGGLLVLLLGVGFILRPASRNSEPIQPATASSVEAALAPPALTPIPPPSAEPDPARPESTNVQDLDQSPAPSAAAPPPTRPAPRRPVAQPKPAQPKPPAPKSKRCDPPYDLDSSGRKIFRVDCL